MEASRFIRHTTFHELPEEEMIQRAREFAEHAHLRRTVRQFSSRPVPREIIELCLQAAGSAPSAGNLQPWRFVAISDWRTKFAIRKGAEQAERDFYGGEAPRRWVQAFVPGGLDATKPYLEKAPWLIAVFAEVYSYGPDREIVQHPFVAESVMIACGILVTALHNAGLVSVTHTPTPMAFLSELLVRPDNHCPLMLIGTGFPEPTALVPDQERLPLEAYAEFIDGEEV